MLTIWMCSTQIVMMIVCVEYLKNLFSATNFNPFCPQCGPVAETVAYDLILKVAMKVQNFKQRNLLLHGPWKWLVTEFASYYGVSDAYTKLRYLNVVGHFPEC